MNLPEQSAIKTIDLTGWEQDPDTHVDGRALNFHLPEASKVQLTFHYRDRSLDADSQRSFAKLLSKPAHELTLQEREEIEMVLRYVSEPEYFGFSNIRTETLNGKMVLLIEGIWKKSRLSTYGIFVSTDANASAVEEIHFVAPHTTFQQFSAKAKQAFNSITWK